MYHLFRLQSVEVGIVYLQARDVSQRNILDLGVEIGKLLYLFIFTGLLSAASKCQNEVRA